MKVRSKEMDVKGPKERWPKVGDHRAQLERLVKLVLLLGGYRE